MVEFEPALQRLREEVQRLGGAIAEFDTHVNDKVNVLFPEYLDGRIGDEFLESAVLLGEAVRDTVGSKPLLEAQKRRLDLAIQVGELAGQGFFGDKGDEIFGRAQETLRESGILLDETSSSQVVTGLLPPSTIPIWRSEVDVAPLVPPPPEVPGPILPSVEIERVESTKVSIAPVDYHNQKDVKIEFNIPIERLTESPITLPDEMLITIPGNRMKILNILRSIPEGMAVTRKSLTFAIFGDTSENFAARINAMLSNINLSLRVWEISNAVSRAEAVRGVESRYYLRRIQQGVEQTSSGVDVAPTIPSPSEVPAPPVPSEIETSDKIELRICPIEEGQDGEVTTFSISRDQIEKDLILISANGQQINVIARRKKELINLVQSLPDGMCVFKTSVVSALGINGANLDALLNQTRGYLKGLGINHTIENKSNENKSKTRTEARYYWKQIEQQVEVEVHDGDGDHTLPADGEVGVPVEPTSGNGEATEEGQGADTQMDIPDLDENAIKQLKKNWPRRRIENVLLVVQDTGDDQLHSKVNDPVGIFAVMSADATISNRVFDRSPDSVTTEEFKVALARVNNYMRSNRIDDLGDLTEALRKDSARESEKKELFIF